VVFLLIPVAIIILNSAIYMNMKDPGDIALLVTLGINITMVAVIFFAYRFYKKNVDQMRANEIEKDLNDTIEKFKDQLKEGKVNDQIINYTQSNIDMLIMELNKVSKDKKYEKIDLSFLIKK
jgi:amino acid permease